MWVRHVIHMSDTFLTHEWGISYTHCDMWVRHGSETWEWDMGVTQGSETCEWDMGMRQGSETYLIDLLHSFISCTAAQASIVRSTHTLQHTATRCNTLQHRERLPLCLPRWFPALLRRLQLFESCVNQLPVTPKTQRTHVSIYMYVLINVYSYIYTYILIHIYLYTHTYIPIYSYIYTYKMWGEGNDRQQWSQTDQEVLGCLVLRVHWLQGHVVSNTSHTLCTSFPTLLSSSVWTETQTRLSDSAWIPMA